MAVAQDYATHRKFVPLYHYVTALLLLFCLGWWIYRTATSFTMDHLVFTLMTVALVLVGFFARAFPAKNQDRIIRLEERLRMAELLPDDLKGDVYAYTTAQLIALRFASDEELPELARKVRDEGIDDREAIKKLVKSWRADHQRI